MNFPVSFGGIIINPGDILVGDSDGLIAIDPKNAEELAKIAKAYHEGEENQLDGIINRGEWPRPWVQDSLKKSWIRICGLADNCILEILVYVIMNLK